MPWRVGLFTVWCAVYSAVWAVDANGAERSKSRPKKLGEATYMSNCEACHMMGKNVIKPGKDIVVSSKLASMDDFKAFLSEAHGVMPAFKKIADEPEVLSALYKFAKKLKDQKWTYVPPLEKTPTDPFQPPQEKKRGKDNNNSPAG